MNCVTEPGQVIDVTVPEKYRHEEQLPYASEILLPIESSIDFFDDTALKLQLFRPKPFRPLRDRFDIALMERALADEGDLSLEEFENELGLN